MRTDGQKFRLGPAWERKRFLRSGRSSLYAAWGINTNRVPKKGKKNSCFKVEENGGWGESLSGPYRGEEKKTGVRLFLRPLKTQKKGRRKEKTLQKELCKKGTWERGLKGFSPPEIVYENIRGKNFSLGVEITQRAVEEYMRPKRGVGEIGER